MPNIKIICVGKLKERFYEQAAGEYIKRLGAFCRVEVEELPEAKRPEGASQAQTDAAVRREGENILAHVPKGAALAAMCVEGARLDSPAFSKELMRLLERGGASVCFVIGGSDGLSDEVKARADARLSMSDMTFPHHLARVMLLEQIYRAFMIAGGSKYHK